MINSPFIKSAIILAGYIFFSQIIKIIIDKIFSGIKQTIKQENLQAKTQTLRSLVKNAVDFVLLFAVILIIFSQFGVDIAPLLTGAGFLGLAVSFGAQTLIKDIISGMFILIENQFNVDDYVKISNFEGKVIKLTLRMTVLKDKDDNLIYIPNSQITSVVKMKKTK